MILRNLINLGFLLLKYVWPFERYKFQFYPSYFTLITFLYCVILILLNLPLPKKAINSKTFLPNKKILKETQG